MMIITYYIFLVPLMLGSSGLLLNAPNEFTGLLTFAMHSRLTYFQFKLSLLGLVLTSTPRRSSMDFRCARPRRHVGSVRQLQKTR